jgi:ATP-binding cassette subfamily F protein uup
MQNPNFLILDEPTNDFDIETMNLLEDFLLKFEGCILAVSHDRWFMDKLVDHLFVFQGEGKIKDFYGSYTDYKEHFIYEKRTEKRQFKEEKTTAEKETNRSNPKKLTYKQERELETLEEAISALETEQQHLLTLLNEDNSNNETLMETSKKYQKNSEDLEIKTSRWFELNENL